MWNTSYYLLVGCGYRDTSSGTMYYSDYWKLRQMSMDTFGRLGLPPLYTLGAYGGFDYSDVIVKANVLGFVGTNISVGQSSYNYLMLYQVGLIFLN
jgi:hypothetical protein